MATFWATVRVVAVVLGLPLAYAGCSAWHSAPLYVKMQTKFDYSEHEPYAKPGENGMTGQGFLTFKQRVAGSNPARLTSTSPSSSSAQDTGLSRR
jgi:hypothetical protein